MSTENPQEKYLARFPFLTPDSRRSVMTILHLFNEIDELAQTNIKVLDAKSDILMSFQKSLKSYCLTTYGNENLWEQVPEAQILKGGTIEERKGITDEQFAEIGNKVLDAISQLEALAAGQKQ